MPRRGIYAGAMLKQELFLNRADRIIAIGRVALAAPALAAAIFDPPRPATSETVVITLLAVYTAVAVGIAIMLWSRRLSSPPIGHWLHALDLAVFAALVYLTRGSSSPFFPLYIFDILSGTLRWDWRGALVTSVVIILLFLPTALFHEGGFDPKRDDVLRFAIRIVQVVVVGGLLSYIGLQRERYWRELLRLSQPIDVQVGTVVEAIRACLDHVRDFFGVPSAIFVWEMRDEPGWRALASGRTKLPRLPGAGWPGPASHAVAGSTFDFKAGSVDGRCYGADGQVTSFVGPLLDPTLANRWGVEEAVVSSIGSDALDGWLIIPKRVTEDDLYLARALSVQLAAALDKAASAETWRSAAASEERIRIAHDLHDGILQFLTGLALQLRLIEKQVNSDPAGVGERIRTVTTALRHEQADLRRFLDDIRPRRAPLPGSDWTLAALASMLADQWDVTIDADAVTEPPPALADEIRLIVREAVANAVRHGGARNIAMTGRVVDAGYRLGIADDGKGLPIAGNFDAATLRRSGFGPRSILDRLARLEGDMTLDTGPTGTLLQIVFPILASAAE